MTRYATLAARRIVDLPLSQLVKIVIGPRLAERANIGMSSHPVVVSFASSPIGERLEEVDDALLAGHHGIRGVEHAAGGLGQSLVDLSKLLIHLIERVIAGHAEKRIGSARPAVRLIPATDRAWPGWSEAVGLFDGP